MSWIPPITALMIGVVAGVQEIHSGVVASTFPITMEELIEFRRDYVGTPEDAIREIIYRCVCVLDPVPGVMKAVQCAFKLLSLLYLLTEIIEQVCAFVHLQPV
jgi:hypothetical protein